MDSIPEGRGHPILNYLRESEDGSSYVFFLGWGANREKQFDDAWLVTVKKSDLTVNFEKVDYTNIDEKFSARSGQASVYDKERQQILILGGQDAVNNVQFNDLFALNKDNEMKKVEFDLSEGMPFPRVRNSHTFVRDHQNQKIYCYGGANADDGPLNDLFEFDQENNDWAQLLTSGKDSPDDVPPALEMHTAHLYYDEESKPHMLILGGRSNTCLSDGVYDLDLEELTWTKIGDMPCAWCSHSSVLINNRYVIVYGGFSGTSILDSIRRFDIQNKKWLTYTKSDDHSNSEFFSDGRIATAMECAKDDIVLLFGGSSPSKDYNDTFCLKVEDLTNSNNYSEITLVL